MARQRYDIGGKWLLQNFGREALRIGGLTNVEHAEPMPGEVVQNRRYPDSLLRAFLQGETRPTHVLVEIATYPERRALKQALDDLTLAYSTLGHLPDLVFLVLRPKGKLRIGGEHEVSGRLGLSRLTARWRTIELWTLSAETFLAEGDVGLLPWVPLMEMAGSPEQALQRCADRITRESPAKKEGDLLAIADVMTELRFPGSELARIFLEKPAMIDSPAIKRWKAETAHEMILEVLKDRFAATPRDITKSLRAILDERKLRRLNLLAAKCKDLDAFREALGTC